LKGLNYNNIEEVLHAFK